MGSKFGVFARNGQVRHASTARARVQLQYEGWTEVVAPVVPEQPPTLTPPPLSGKGSSRDAWAEYAAANKVKIADDATRDDIVAALETAGVATEASGGDDA